MGYTTEFAGYFQVDPVLSEEHASYLLKFADTRRMTRNPALLTNMPDSTREVVGLPLGEDGAYFTGGDGPFGQALDASVVDANRPPAGQPGLWCKWAPSDDRSAIEWDGSEKFSNYVPWLEYLMEHFLKPWGYRVNGTCYWQGEDFFDRGVITIVAGSVFSHKNSKPIEESYILSGDSIDNPDVDTLLKRHFEEGDLHSYQVAWDVYCQRQHEAGDTSNKKWLELVYFALISALGGKD